MAGLDEYGPETPRSPERKSVLELLRTGGLSPIDEEYLSNNPDAIRAIVRLVQEAQFDGSKMAGQNKINTRKRLDTILPRLIYEAALKHASPSEVAAALSGGIPDPALAGRLLGGGRTHPLTRAQIKAYDRGRHKLPWDQTITQEWQEAKLRHDEKVSLDNASIKSAPRTLRPRLSREERARIETLRAFALLSPRLEHLRGQLRATASKPWADDARTTIDKLSTQIADCYDMINDAQISLSDRGNEPISSELRYRISQIQSNLSLMEREYARLVEDE